MSNTYMFSASNQLPLCHQAHEKLPEQPSSQAVAIQTPLSTQTPGDSGQARGNWNFSGMPT